MSVDLPDTATTRTGSESTMMDDDNAILLSKIAEGERLLRTYRSESTVLGATNLRALQLMCHHRNLPLNGTRRMLFVRLAEWVCSITL
jgi:hypothetical protein